MDGSSPRARGTLFGAQLGIAHGRFIPAGAGNTCNFRGMGVAAPVHPRGRGEHFGRSYDGRSGFGSSPRARGTHLTFLGKQYDPRFIPAGAGNTSPPRPPPWPRPVHPRGRGEHLSRSSCSSGVSGSSPRARGTRREVGPVVGLIRFIPAGAGNTGDIRSDKDVIRGSSPRARGTRQALLFTGELRRFIPAGAGNTELKFEIQKPNPVHPRGRGEHGHSIEPVPL